MILLWQVPQDMKLASSGEPAIAELSGGGGKPANLVLMGRDYNSNSRNLSELRGTNQRFGEPANKSSSFSLY